MKVVVLGSNGMLGREVVRQIVLRSGWEVVGYDLPELDIRKVEASDLPDCDWVVNCAAYTDVNKAEGDVTSAFEVNCCGAGRVARICNSRGIRLLHMSTDYVFNGEKVLGQEYDEAEGVEPLNAYGMSKLMGETLVMQELPGALIVRTQGLYGFGGVNFVDKILGRVKGGEEFIQVVGDQYCCPTYVGDLAVGMIRLMELGEEGVVHVSSEGGVSWYEFAKMILSEMCLEGVVVERVSSAEYASKVERPRNSVLCKARYTILTGMEMPGVRDGLSRYLHELGNDEDI